MIHSSITHRHDTKWLPNPDAPRGQRFVGVPMRLLAIAPGCATGLRFFVRSQQARPGALQPIRGLIGRSNVEALAGAGHALAYLAVRDVARFQRQLEPLLARVLLSDSLMLQERCRLAYYAGVHLVQEALSGEEAIEGERLVRFSEATADLVLSDRRCFQYFFDGAPRDPQVAKHSMNVAAWMLCLALQLDVTDRAHLAQICQAGMLHDVGKRFVADEILSDTRPLSDEAVREIQRHPELGLAYLRQMPAISKLARRVCFEHHERLDGSGYPRGLKGSDIGQESRMCSVIDAFDAMTAMRPIERRVLSAAEALEAIESQAPAKYDAKIVAQWRKLVDWKLHYGDSEHPPVERRTSPQRRAIRRPVDRPATIRVVGSTGAPQFRACAAQIINSSRGGLCIRSAGGFEVGARVEIVIEPQTPLEARMEGRVVRSQPEAGAQFRIGIHLIAIS